MRRAAKVPARPMVDVSQDAHETVQRIQEWFKRHKMIVPRRSYILNRAITAGLCSEFAKQLGNGR